MRVGGLSFVERLTMIILHTSCVSGEKEARHSAHTATNRTQQRLQRFHARKWKDTYTIQYHIVWF